MRLFIITFTLFLFKFVASQVSCTVVHANPMNYTCSALGITTQTTNLCSSTLSCGQTSITNINTTGTATLTFPTYSCETVGTGYVIKCLHFAGAGKVGGACSQFTKDVSINPKQEACDFKEDPSGSFVWLPEEVGYQCIGKTSCPIIQTNTGFTYNGKDYNLRDSVGAKQKTSLSTCCSGGEVKFKVIAICGPPSGSAVIKTCSDSPNMILSVFVLFLTLFLF